MAAGKVNITIEQGATFRKQLIWNAAGGGPNDLTGYTARMQIREKVSDTSPTVDITTANSGITLGGTAGTIDLFISDVATDAITFQSGVYDLEMVDTGGSGDVTRLIEGVVTVSKSVTR